VQHSIELTHLKRFIESPFEAAAITNEYPGNREGEFRKRLTAGFTGLSNTVEESNGKAASASPSDAVVHNSARKGTSLQLPNGFKAAPGDSIPAGRRPEGLTQANPAPPSQVPIFDTNYPEGFRGPLPEAEIAAGSNARSAIPDELTVAVPGSVIPNATSELAGSLPPAAGIPAATVASEPAVDVTSTFRFAGSLAAWKRGSDDLGNVIANATMDQDQNSGKEIDPSNRNNSSPVQPMDKMDSFSLRRGDRTLTGASGLAAASSVVRDLDARKSITSLNYRDTGAPESTLVDTPAIDARVPEVPFTSKAGLRSNPDLVLSHENAVRLIGATQDPGPTHLSIDHGPDNVRFDLPLASTRLHSERSDFTVPSQMLNLYQKMDQMSGVPTPIVSAGTNRVTVSLRDPTLGWLEVKTQSTGGQIAAALVTSSEQSHQTLAAQISSMAQFLSDREVRISSISVEQQTVGGSLGDAAGFENQANSNRHTNADSGSSEIGLSARLAGPDSGPETTEWFHPLSYISVIA